MRPNLKDFQKEGLKRATPRSWLRMLELPPTVCAGGSVIVIVTAMSLSVSFSGQSDNSACLAIDRKPYLSSFWPNSSDPTTGFDPPSDPDKYPVFFFPSTTNMNVFPTTLIV